MSSKRMNRLDKIMKVLMLQSGVSIKDFSKQLEVSEITVRRDLQYLEQQGKLRLINGVAIYRPAVETAPYIRNTIWPMNIPYLRRIRSASAARQPP